MELALVAASTHIPARLAAGRGYFGEMPARHGIYNSAV